MQEKLKHIRMYAALIVLWLFPSFFQALSVDAEYGKTLFVYLLFLVAAALCRLLPNRHAALITALVIGAGMCVLFSSAIYDVLPALLLCCWLRCWRESEKGDFSRVYFEIVTDLIYAAFIAAVVRLFGSGYTFMRIERADTRTMPELCLMALVLVLFLVFFFVGVGERSVSAGGAKKKKRGRSNEKCVVGLIPVYASLRTFWGFCALLLAVGLLQYTNGRLLAETVLVFRSGFRLLFFPWMVLLFLAIDALPAAAAVFQTQTARG